MGDEAGGERGYQAQDTTEPSLEEEEVGGVALKEGVGHDRHDGGTQTVNRFEQAHDAATVVGEVPHVGRHGDGIVPGEAVAPEERVHRVRGLLPILNSII